MRLACSPRRHANEHARRMLYGKHLASCSPGGGGFAEPTSSASRRACVSRARPAATQTSTRDACSTGNIWRLVVRGVEALRNPPLRHPVEHASRVLGPPPRKRARETHALRETF